METLLETKIAEEKKPSLLRQIVDEADMMDDEEKINLLKKIRLAVSLKKAIEIDIELSNCEKLIAEDEIADMISSYRKEQYSKKMAIEK